MTLFIDNIRLYHRSPRYTAVEEINAEWRMAKDAKIRAFQNQDLLAACAGLRDMNFIIFTGFEDTPIDEEIFGRIPENVLGIYGSNALAFGGKVHPMPYGLQRQMSPRDLRHEYIKTMMHKKITPTNLLYLNHSTFTNPRRATLNECFAKKTWATVKKPLSSQPNHYVNYLTDIKKHQFVLCPSGNAKGCDCHRDWETLYMRRVPVVERSPYLEKVFDGLPVLFVNDFSEVTEELLKANIHMYAQAQTFSFDLLDIEKRFKKIINDTHLSYQSTEANR